MKKCLTIIVFVCLALLCGCSKVNSLISDIDNLSMSNVSQEKVDDIVERYNALSDKEKKKITNYSIIEKYENVNDIISDIDNLSTSDIGQEEIDDLFERYNALSNEEKEKITNYNIIEKYEDVDIGKVNAIVDKISKISTDTTFLELLDIYNDYENFNDNEKALVVFDDVLDRFKLTNEEKAAVAACQYIKKA